MFGLKQPPDHSIIKSKLEEGRGKLKHLAAITRTLDLDDSRTGPHLASPAPPGHTFTSCRSSSMPKS